MRRTEGLQLAALLVVGLLPRLLSLLLGPDRLVTLIPDDGFYYFQVARQIAAGHGSSFDPVSVTNGYHPLWMLVCWLLARVTVDPWQLAHLALLAGAALQLLAAVVLYTAVREATGRPWAAALATAFYYLNDRSLLAGLNGLETALTSLCFALVLRELLRRGSQPDGRDDQRLGLLLCLLFLARTDHAIYAVAAGLWAIFTGPRAQRLRTAGFLFVTGLAVAGPWLLWNYVLFGSAIQTSGMAFPFVMQEGYRAAGQGTGDVLVRSAGYFVSYLTDGLYLNLGWSRALWYVAFVGLVLVALLRRRDPELQPREAFERGFGLAGAMLLAALVLVFVHTFLRWYPREWYFDSLNLLWSFAVGLGLAALQPGRWLERLGGLLYPAAQPAWPTFRRIALLLVLLIPLASLTRGAKRMVQGAYPHQAEMLDAARWLDANLPPGSRVGVFNAGVMAYGASQVEIINLDGVISQPAWQAIQQRDLSGWMRQVGVDYYADYEPAMWPLYDAFAGPERPEHRPLTRIDRLEVGWLGDGIHIDRLVWPGGR